MTRPTKVCANRTTVCCVMRAAVGTTADSVVVPTGAAQSLNPTPIGPFRGLPG
jgi:hypothetical protein